MERAPWSASAATTSTTGDGRVKSPRRSPPRDDAHRGTREPIPQGNVTDPTAHRQLNLDPPTSWVG